jgi:hypothetical protein
MSAHTPTHLDLHPIPTELLAIATKRVVLRLTDSDSNNMILGSGMCADDEVVAD